ncbi:MAG: choice-of-anchor L domain-containing protein [Actinomycetes bacterium]
MAHGTQSSTTSLTRGLRTRAVAGLAALATGPVVLVAATQAAAFSAPVVLFSSSRDSGGAPTVDLYALDGSGISRLTTTEPNHQSSETVGWREPELSADGTTVVAVRQDGTSSYVAALDATSPGTVLWEAVCDGGTGPTWSPDGTRVAYVTSTGDIATVNSSGGDCAHVTSTEAGDAAASDVTWSPDGTSLAYTTADVEPQLVVVSADGTTTTVVATPEPVREPAWAPDGHSIAVTYAAQQGLAVGVVPVPNGGLQAVVDLPGDDRAPTWSGDGTQLVFANTGAEVPGLHAVTVGGPLQRLTRWAVDGEPDVAGSPVPAPEPGEAGTTTTLQPLTSLYYGQDFTVASALRELDGDAVMGRTLSFSVGSQADYGTTDETGTAYGSLTVLEAPGTATVHADFPGGTGYLPSADSTTVDVLKSSCTVHNATATEQLTSLGVLQAEAYFDNVHGSGGTDGRAITFVATGDAGEFSGTAVTSAGGYASTSLAVPAGTYSVQAAFSGDDYFDPCTSPAVTVTVTDTEVVVSPARASSVVGTTRDVVATVTRAGGSASGIPVTLTVSGGPSAGDTVVATTGSDGTVTFPRTSASLGTDVVHVTTEDSAGNPVTSGRTTLSWLHPPAGSAGLAPEPLGQVTATDLAQTLAGSGVTVSNVVVTGADTAFGTFAGGDGIVGFGDGIVLSTGAVAGVAGPNTSDGAGTAHGSAGDAVLDGLAAATTYDAAVLSFDFVPMSDRVSFRYAFGSEEYDEFVYGGYNDVFAFHVNGRNCALVPATTDAVAVDTVNGGNEDNETPPANPHLFMDNEPNGADDHQLDTQLDGLTTVLSCASAVVPGEVNTMRLAIADAGDGVLDSAVFLQADSLVSLQPLALDVTADDALVPPGGATGYEVAATNPNTTTQTVTSLSVTLPDGFAYTPGTTTGVTTAEPVVSGQQLSWALEAPVAPGGGSLVHVGVTAAAAPGTYLTSAAGTATGVEVTGFGPGAAVEVVDVVRTVAVTPSTGTALVGTSADLTVTVLDDGVAAPSVPVTVTVTDGPHAGTELVASTGADGTVVVSYTGTAAGTDTLTGTAPAPTGGTLTASPVTRTWTEEQPVIRLVELAPTGTSARVGTSHQVMATVTDDGVPVPGTDVTFRVTSGPSATTTASVTTASDGTAAWTWTSPDPGTDVVVAAVAGVTSGTVVESPPAEHTWLAGPALTLAPDGSAGVVGTTHTVVATAVDAGVPLVTDVTFEVTSGPNAGLTTTVTTAANGTAELALTSSASGTDVIAASFVDTLTESPVVAAPVSHAWTEEPVPVWTVTLSPSGTTADVGTSHVVTATVRVDGVVLENAFVSFEVLSGPHAGQVGDGTTDALGQVAYTWTGALDGTDTVVAYANTLDCYTGGGTCPPVDVVSNEVTHTWLLPPPVVTTVDLSPSGTSAPVGADHTVTATVQHDGDPAAGVPVTFTVTSGPRAGHTGTATTGTTGTAAFTWSSSEAGTDSVVAAAPDAAGEGEVTSRPVTHAWTQPVVTPTPTPTPTPTGTPAPPVAPAAPAGPVVTAGGPAAERTADPPPTPEPTTTQPSSLPFAETPGQPPAETVHPVERGLRLAEPSTVPGGSTVITGEGCSPGAAVDLAVDGVPAGTLLADDDGTFEGALSVPDLPIGRHPVTATCGDVVQETSVDLVLSTSTGGLSGGAAATGGLVLCFFVLLAGQLLRGTGAPAAAAGHRPVEDDDLVDDLFA